ncbi:hypothetical protein CYMTET_49959 [Cymbomonas tetramitiformis]|uniref:AAA+ ATPase domain-containing protein n=1 Tax=Cymbomonas tetramitiformis TaxID=36881 RepID=A0AAE0ETC9_9CHLO|nr:hypothetical protein CYMTET_49959 [Cymbomonas tetramitiformis]
MHTLAPSTGLKSAASDCCSSSARAEKRRAGAGILGTSNQTIFGEYSRNFAQKTVKTRNIGRFRVYADYGTDGSITTFSKKALKRIAKEGPKAKDLRDEKGFIRKECLGAPVDLRLPKFSDYTEMEYSDFINGLNAGEFSKVEMWQDKEEYWWPPTRTYWKGRRAIVTTNKGEELWVDMPFREFEDIAMETIASTGVDVGWHQPPGRDGIIKKSGIPVDQVQAMEFAQSRSNARKEGMTGITFKDVAGLGTTVDELQEVVAFLKDPTRFNTVGAKPPKGLLLEGPPGCGKTLIAKAVAGEADVPFYSMSGSEFVEIIVGVGAARVRDLFKRARVNAPCLIFVDEIDALGSKRAPAMMQGNEEREQTLNQLLTEMDGFTPDTGVIFIGATNRADLLDPALLRPGRFDRKVMVKRPNTDGRAEVLRVHAKKVKLSKDVDLDQLARDLPGLSGAELVNVINEAALMALRRGAQPTDDEGITLVDIYNAVDRILQGVERSPLSKDLPVVRRFACYEIGHALTAEVLRTERGNLEEVERVSIQPRGDQWTRTVFLRAEDETYSMATRARMLDRLQVMLAGRAAEEVLYGDPTTYSMMDLQDATVLARRIITNYGLSEDMEITTYVDLPPTAGSGAVYNMWKKFSGQVEGVDGGLYSSSARTATRPGSKSMAHAHRAASKLVNDAYEANLTLLKRHRAALLEATDAIMEKDLLSGEELQAIMASNPPIDLDDAQGELPAAYREGVAF